jgi:hypothetical protein
MQHERVATWGLLGIGLLLLGIAIFLDPIGVAPDSGLFDLGSTGTRWLLGSLGCAFILRGVWTVIQKK